MRESGFALGLDSYNLAVSFIGILGARQWDKERRVLRVRIREREWEVRQNDVVGFSCLSCYPNFPKNEKSVWVELKNLKIFQ